MFLSFNLLTSESMHSLNVSSCPELLSNTRAKENLLVPCQSSHAELGACQSWRLVTFNDLAFYPERVMRFLI